MMNRPKPEVMTKLDVDGLTERLREACRRAQEKGFEIEPGEWGLQEWQGRFYLNGTPNGLVIVKRCCPLAALLDGVEKLPPEQALDDEIYDRCQEAAVVLGVPLGFAIGVAKGFDGEDWLLAAGSHVARLVADHDGDFQIGYQIGEKLRIEFWGSGPTSAQMRSEQSDQTVAQDDLNDFWSTDA